MKTGGRGYSYRDTGGSMAGRGLTATTGGKAPCRGRQGYTSGVQIPGRGAGTYRGRGAPLAQTIGHKRPAQSQSGGRGSQQVPYLPRANAAVQERQEWDSTGVYDEYSQEGEVQDHTEDYEEDIQEEYPSQV